MHDEYLRRNLILANAEGAVANSKHLLSKIRSLPYLPQWLIKSVAGIQERAEKTIPDLVKWRNSAYDNPYFVNPEGNMLPPIGSTVWIHLNSMRAWMPHKVVGYYVLENLNDSDILHYRVFIQVKDVTNDNDAVISDNARLLHEVRLVNPHGEDQS